MWNLSKRLFQRLFRINFFLVLALCTRNGRNENTNTNGSQKKKNFRKSFENETGTPFQIFLEESWRATTTQLPYIKRIEQLVERWDKLKRSGSRPEGEYIYIYTIDQDRAFSLSAHVWYISCVFEKRKVDERCTMTLFLRLSPLRNNECYYTMKCNPNM